jgi:hypothetical protein
MITDYNNGHPTLAAVMSSVFATESNLRFPID